MNTQTKERNVNVFERLSDGRAPVYRYVQNTLPSSRGDGGRRLGINK